MDQLALQEIALEVGRALAIDDVLDSIVGGLAREPGVALARIWLMDRGDICEDCALRPECPNQERCLHLRASAGHSTVDPGLSWTRIDGHFRRFPLRVRKVGRIGATGTAELLHIGQGESPWLADPEWAEREGIQTFAGHPLVFHDEVVGVLGLFCRRNIDPEESNWLRIFADHAAVALANARAFQEVDDLRHQLELERDYLREEIKVVQAFCGIIGESPATQKVLHQIEAVAPTDATVLIHGESGTGKELISCAIHEQSLRKGGSLVRVNCASIPRELFESEFFGHVKGSFTGATSARAGRFQVADGGTLFLDEVGEIPLDLQPKLLRALQDGRISRVGEDEELEVDVRVIAATNRDLEAEVAAGRFREDLYYRLTVFPIQVPPLRDRVQDIPLLATHFLEQAVALRATGPEPKLRERDVAALQAYDWPGNVRELQNVIERSVILSRGNRLVIDLGAGSAAPGAGGRASMPSAGEVLTDAEMQEAVRANTIAALEKSNWRVSGPTGAATLLGMKPNTLASRMKAMAIQKPR